MQYSVEFVANKQTNKQTTALTCSCQLWRSTCAEKKRERKKRKERSRVSKTKRHTHAQVTRFFRSSADTVTQRLSPTFRLNLHCRAFWRRWKAMQGAQKHEMQHPAKKKGGGRISKSLRADTQAHHLKEGHVHVQDSDDAIKSIHANTQTHTHTHTQHTHTNKHT